MNWLSLIGALMKLAASLAALFRDRALAADGEARGRAASDAEHARAAEARGRAMRDISARAPARAEIDKRLEEGSA